MHVHDVNLPPIPNAERVFSLITDNFFVCFVDGTRRVGLVVFKNLISLLGKVGLWDFNTHELISCIVRQREVKKEQTAEGDIGAPAAGSTFNARTNIDGTELRARSLMERWVEKIKRNKKTEEIPQKKTTKRKKTRD